MIDCNENFQTCYWFQMVALCSIKSHIASFYDIVHHQVLYLDIHASQYLPTVFPGLMWPPFFVVYSLMVILIEK